MKTINVLAILPYEGMKEIIINAAKEFEEISLYAYVGDLEEGVRIVKERSDDQEYDLIISRGGTAELLKKELKDRTILEIQTSFEDVFHAVLLARNYQEKFAIVSFPVIAKRAKELCVLLRYDIEVHTIRSEQEAVELLKKLQKAGYTMVVGDMITALVAKRFGMNPVLIMSGRESIDMTLRQAQQLAVMKKKISGECEILKSMQQTLPVHFTVLDEQGNVVESNVKNTEENDRYLAFVRENIELFKKKSDFYLERRFGKTIFIIHSARREMDGETLFFVYGRSVYMEVPEKKGGIFLAEEADNEGYVFESSFGVINSVGQAREAILQCCDSRLPVLILGEPGTGKDAAASSIYHMGYNRGGAYFIIDCELVTGKEWNQFFEKPTSPLLDVNCTIYFKNIQALSSVTEKKLRDLIEYTNLCKRNQIIFSAVVRRGEEKCLMAEYILNRVKCFLLQALPIQQRKKDVKSLSVIYLNALNVELGKQIIGFEPEAEEELMNYHWPGNVTQLKRVLREAVMRTKECYITRNNIRMCIRNEIFLAPDENVYNINLEQSLYDITYEIVCMVMKQENMNQKRTAERLKVSRTTIWRILKEHETDLQPKGV